MHHSDRGSQYLSIRYTERLAEAGIAPSAGSIGDGYDNALAETINRLFKAEVIHRRGPWRGFEAVEDATLEWLDWFNNRRLPEPIGNIPPAEAEANLVARHDVLAATVPVPHPDRIVTLKVVAKTLLRPDVLDVVLAPVEAGACFCEFVPGQYIELWQPGSDHLSRSYSIANAPTGDGRIELQLRRVAGGRLTDWAFEQMAVGDTLRARGPLGAFTMRSPADVPLLFVAGGTGYAPIHALIAQQARFRPERDMVLVWGMRMADQFYGLDDLAAIKAQAPGLRVILATEEGTVPLSAGMQLVRGTALDALASGDLVAGRDIYAAGPPMLLRGLVDHRAKAGVDPGRLHVDSFGV